jgi:hypothetical protein
MILDSFLYRILNPLGGAGVVGAGGVWPLSSARDTAGNESDFSPTVEAAPPMARRLRIINKWKK